MFNFIILLTLGLASLATAKPSGQLSYSSSPLYTTAAGSSQLDVRNNYNSASGYSNSIGYASPLTSARIVAQASPSFAYSAPIARYSPSILAGPFGYSAPSLAARYESPFVGAGYASPYAAASYATPYAASYTPFIPNYGSPYTAAYHGTPYTIAAPGSAPIIL